MHVQPSSRSLICLLYIYIPVLRSHFKQKEFVWKELHFGAYWKKRKKKLRDESEAQKEAAEME